MKFTVVVISMLALQASASFLDKVRGIFLPLEETVEHLVTDVVSDLQNTIDCTIMAVENVFSFGGMFAINPEYERRCKNVTKDLAVTPTAQDTYYTQDTETSNAHRLQMFREMARGNENATNVINKHFKDSVINISPKIQYIIEKNDAQTRISNVNSDIKNETDRLVVISRMIRHELDNLSPDIKRRFNLHDIDLEHVSVQEVLGEIGALYKVEQSDKSSIQANEIRHLFDKILNIIRINNTDDRVYSDDDEVKEIFKNLEETENNTLINTEKKLLILKEGDLQKNSAHDENTIKLHKEFDDIPKTFQDIAKKIFNQGSTNSIRRSNASEIMGSLNETNAVKIQNADFGKNVQYTVNQIMDESKTRNMNQILKLNQQFRNVVKKSIKEEHNGVSSESFHKNVDKILKLSKETKQNINITNRSNDIANHILEESHTVDTNQIVKSAEEATNIIGQSIKQKKNYYISNIVQRNVDDIFKKPKEEHQNIDVTNSFQSIASQIMDESRTGETTNHYEQAFVPNSAQKRFGNPTLENLKENLNVTNTFQSIANQVIEDMKPVDTDNIVKSTKGFSQSTNQQEQYSVSNNVRTRVNDILNDAEKEYQRINVTKSSQNTVSRIMEDSKTVNATTEQEQARISNNIQKSVYNILEDSMKQKENVGIVKNDIANNFRSITNQVVEESKPVDSDQILKSTEGTTNIFNPPTIEQQNYYVSKIVQSGVDDIFKNSEKEYQNVDVTNSFQNVARQIIEKSNTDDITKEQQQSFVSNTSQGNVNYAFEASNEQKENVDLANNFQSIASEAIEVSKPTNTDQIVKSAEEATNIFRQPTNEQEKYDVSNIAQASVNDIFNNSENIYQNIGVTNSFKSTANQVMEELKTEETTKEQQQAFVSNSSQESVNNIFEESINQKKEVGIDENDIANNFRSITNQVVEESKPVDSDQILKSTEGATNIFNPPTTEQQNYSVSNIVQSSVDDIFKNSENEYQNVDVTNSFQNVARQIMDKSNTDDKTKEQQQSFVSNTSQENVNNAFEASNEQKENVDLANNFQSIASEAIEVSKPMDTDQILKSAEEATNIFSQPTNEQEKYDVSNIVQASVNDIFKDSEKVYQNIDVSNGFQSTGNQVMEELKTEDTTKEQEQAFDSNNTQERFTNTYDNLEKPKEDVNVVDSFQSMTNQIMEESKSMDHTTNIFRQSTNDQHKYYVSNIVQSSVDDIFKNSENEYQNVDVTNSFQNVARQIMEKSNTDDITKEQQQSFVYNTNQENVNNAFEASNEHKENIDLANNFQSIASEAIEVSKPVDTDQIVKSTEEDTNMFGQSTNEQQKYYVSNNLQASVNDIFKDSEKVYQNIDVSNSFQSTGNQVMEELKTEDTTKEQEQAFDSNNTQERFTNTYDNLEKPKKDVNVVDSFQLMTNQIIEESKPMDTDQIVKSTEETTNIFRQSINDQHTYYVSNIAQASVDDIFKDSAKENHNIDINNSFQSASSLITKETVTEDSTKNQEQNFVSNGIQNNKILENSNIDKENVANSFQSTASQRTEGSQSVYTQQTVKTRDQEENSRSSQDNLNNTFEQSKSEAPKPVVPIQGPNAIDVNTPPPPVIMSAPTTTTTEIPDFDDYDAHTTTTTEIPDFDDYDKETNTDKLSFFSQLFGSSSDDHNILKRLFGNPALTDNRKSEAQKEAESMIESSRRTEEFFKKVNKKNAQNVFDKPDLFNFGKKKFH